MFWLPLIILIFWLFCIATLWAWKATLFKKTWNEPYFLHTVVVIESDDWGPGGDFHATRLTKLLNVLDKHKDDSNRSAVLTADMVLSVPDIAKIKATLNGEYFRIKLDSFLTIYRAMQEGILQGTFVPQLHGLEHLNGKAFALLCQSNDYRLQGALANDQWWDWETLDSPLQGHYVNGSSFPTQAISPTDAKSIIQTASQLFNQLFHYPSDSTVAPCYLWNNDIEQEWDKQNIKIIQTAGYRCIGRDKTGYYIQNPSVIRVGDKNDQGQIYLVRNVMFEPVDGKNTTETAFNEANAAFKQATPISISTHRYNFTRSEEEFNDSLAGLNQLLNLITEKLPKVRFLSSPELGNTIIKPQQTIINHFNHSSWPEIKTYNGLAKLSPFLYRLYYRHPKLVMASYLSGLIIPAWLICKTRTLKSNS